MKTVLIFVMALTLTACGGWRTTNEGCKSGVAQWKSAINYCNECAPVCAVALLPSFSCKYNDLDAFYAASNAEVMVAEAFLPALNACRNCVYASEELTLKCYPPEDEE